MRKPEWSAAIDKELTKFEKNLYLQIVPYNGLFVSINSSQIMLILYQTQQTIRLCALLYNNFEEHWGRRPL